MDKLDSVIMRMAMDDYVALQTANAMQSLPHVEVISIVCRPNGVWCVFAKYDRFRLSPDTIDKAIEKAAADEADTK